MHDVARTVSLRQVQAGDAVATPLSFVKLGFEARLAEPDPALGFLGPTLRGVLGYVLKDLVCIRPPPKICESCTLRPACPFPRIFDGVPADPTTFGSGSARVPQPFVIGVAPPEHSLETRTTLHWTVTLFGEAARWSPYLIETFVQSGRRGIGPNRTPFELVSVTDEYSSRTLFAAFGDGVSVPREHDARVCSTPEDGTLRWYFQTPLELRRSGRVLDEPDGLDLVLAGRRRWRALTAHYGMAGEDGPPYLDRSDFAVRRRDARRWGFSRFSKRQQQRMDLRGLIGEIDIEGPWSRAGEWIQAVPATHLGKHTSFGFGRVRWEQIA